MEHSVEIELGGRTIRLETGKLAKQANGAVLVRSGNAAVLVTACTAPQPKPGASFFPLTVDYREYTFAAGKIPGGFIKREGRPSEKEVLTSRLIDRPIRPLFPEGYQHETQVMAMVFSADPTFDPASLAIIGAGAALAISDIPFEPVLSGLRVSLVDGTMLAVPSYEQEKGAVVSIVVAGTDEGITMVEASGLEASEEQALQAIAFAHDSCRTINASIRELVAKAGKPKRAFIPAARNTAMFAQLSDALRADLVDALDAKTHGKLESYRRVDEAKVKAKTLFPEEQQAEAGKLFDALKEEIFRDQILKDRVRPDRRAFDEIREISAETALLPRVHGSSLFTRGETQAMVTVTLGTKDDEQRLESFNAAETTRRFMLHYNFPPFSVGETGFLRGPGRREIGHGALAERALSPMLPDEKVFPYTLRVVSDILESNGSSSMASVCGGSLALMDAGVPMKAAVAGVAMGLVVGDAGEFAVLTDIAGAEDHYGDMDFKVAGTRKGINALQMDIKVTKVTIDIMRQALEQAKAGRLFILDKMDAALAQPRATLSEYAPRITTTRIPVDKIRELIGPGGKMIRAIQDTTQTKIDVSDDGTVNIFATDAQSGARALQMVQDIGAVAEVGKTYLGKVVRLAEFGAFVEIFPGTDGLLHISEISEQRVKTVKDELNEGDQILVKVLALEGNKIKLSRKAVLREQREKLKVGGE